MAGLSGFGVTGPETPGAGASGVRRGVIAAVAGLLALAALLRAGMVLNLPVDPDESQHLRIAWLVGQGAVPYRDFWEHHMPLFHYLVAPLARSVPEGPGLYLAARTLMAGAAAVTLALTYRLARGLSGPAAGVTVVALAFLPRFAENTTEVRPDVLALVAWVLGLQALVSWRRTGAGAWLGRAGLWQGVAVALSLKAVYGAAGAALVVAGAAWRGSGAGPLAALVRFSAAAAAGPAAVALVLLAHGGTAAVAGLIDLVIGESLRFVDFSKDPGVAAVELGVVGLAVAGVGVAASELGRAVLRDPLHGTLLVATGAVVAGLLWPGTPAVYRHAWLPVVPVVALYAGLAAARGLEWAHRDGGPAGRRGAWLALGLALGAPAISSARAAVTPRSQEAFTVMRRQLALSCPGEPVLDGTGLYVFRPAAYRYGALLNGVREWIARGVVPEERIEADIRAARPRIAYADRRLLALVGPVGDLLKRQYVTLGDGFLVAGASVPVPGGPAGGRAYVDLLVDGPFLLTADPGIAVAIDARPVAGGWVTLPAGRHELTWTGPPGAIRLAAATCPERRALGLAPHPRPWFRRGARRRGRACGR